MILKQRHVTLATIIAFGGFAFHTHAYKEVTHQQIAINATQSTVLADFGVLKRIGLHYPYDVKTQSQVFPNSIKAGEYTLDENPRLEPGGRTIQELIGEGVIYEDHGIRALNHFFDPTTGRPLNIAGVSLLNNPSPSWALEDQGDVISDGASQEFSYRHAREYLFAALTKADKAERDRYWGLTFRTLGQVIHHVEDMAQPQHVRNDSHLDKFKSRLNPLHNPSLYESWTNEDPVRNALPFFGYSALDLSRFHTPRSFWTGSSRGMADFTNGNFVSAGTNAESGRYVEPVILLGLPPEERDIQELCANANPPCKNQNLSGVMAFFGNYVNDAYTGESVFNQRATTWSIFGPDLEKRAKDMPDSAIPKAFTLNRFNFAEFHKHLIPRAVAYSAGLINYFFRGQLAIRVPDDGVYAIVDHSAFTGNTDARQGYRGFGEIKLRVKNVTPSLTGGSEPEPMTGGELLAILKFHRNLCYRDDLSGEPGAQGIDRDSCRTEDEEIVVSDAINPVSLTGSEQQFKFKFTRGELPINATDVYLQLVYRGPLGEEPDAVVVTTQDISEPTYFAYNNAKDYIHIGQNVYTRDEVNQNEYGQLDRIYPASCVDRRVSPPMLQPECFNPSPLDITFTIASDTSSRTMVVQGLPVQRFIRVAMLQDTGPQDQRLPVTINHMSECVPRDPFPINSLKWQVEYVPGAAGEPSKLVTYGSQATPVRGIYGWITASCVHMGDEGPDTPDDRNVRMTALPAANQYPFPVTISP